MLDRLDKQIICENSRCEAVQELTRERVKNSFSINSLAPFSIHHVLSTTTSTKVREVIVSLKASELGP